MIGRIIGGVVGSAMGRANRSHPIAGAVIGAGAMFAARRIFPPRYAALAATASAAYLTKKWAERKAAEAAQKEAAATPTGPNSPTAPIVQRADDAAADKAVSGVTS